MTDYDLTDIPAAYDRARDHGPEVLDLWMRTVAASVDARSIRRILDLGCGTGRFSEGLAARFDAEVIGLDRSQKMLQLARQKQRDSRVRSRRATPGSRTYRLVRLCRRQLSYVGGSQVRVMMTFPFLCPCSTYSCASAICSSG